jgi:coenzyme PQQ precursor peptide PqqA
LTEPAPRVIAVGTERQGFRVRKASAMSWETPSFIEIDMSAEIGSYEGEDFDGL